MRTRVVAVPLAGLADTGGGIGAWQNPERVPIIITRLVVVTSVVSTGACTMDAGTTATSAVTLSDTLIDGLDMNAALLPAADNITDKGTNGKSRQSLASGKWVTFSTASGASAGLVGTAFIEYFRTA